MSKIIIKYPASLKAQAFKCSLVASLFKLETQIEETPGEGRKAITMNKDDVTLTGSPAICKYMVEVGSSGKSEVEQARLVQWTSFADSELSHYAAGGKQMEQSLNYLNNLLEKQPFLNGEGIGAEDVIVAFPLLIMGDRIEQAAQGHPSFKVWIEKVKQQNGLDDFLKSSAGAVESTKKQKKEKKEKPKKAANETPKNAPTKKLKLLCLHGYRQSAKASREKLGSFRKMTAKQVELVFINAPNAVPSTEDEDNSDQYGWWFSQPCGTYEAHEVSSCQKGFPESLEVVRSAFEKEGPFDGIFSFSQGASLGAQLCVLQEMGKLEYSFKFAILVAGFMSRAEQHMAVYDSLDKEGKTVSIPTLHVFGETDKVIEKSMSEELLKYFSNPDIITHSGGHFVPSTGGEAKKGFVDFLNKMLDTLK